MVADSVVHALFEKTLTLGSGVILSPLLAVFTGDADADRVNAGEMLVDELFEGTGEPVPNAADGVDIGDALATADVVATTVALAVEHGDIEGLFVTADSVEEGVNWGVAVPNCGDALVDGLRDTENEAVAVDDSEAADDADADEDPAAVAESNEDKDVVTLTLP